MDECSSELKSMSEFRFHSNSLYSPRPGAELTSSVSSGKYTLWKICVVLCWMASTSTWCGGYFRWPCRSVFCSRCAESSAIGCRRVRRN